MKAFIILACLVCYTIAASGLTEEQYKGLFSRFMSQYKKTYESNEVANRYAVFKGNLDYIIEWNKNPENTHTLGMNQFGDMTEQEWDAYKGFKVPDNLGAVPKENQPDEKFNNVQVKEAVDWRKEGVVNPVYNQGSCGSCYAWSSIQTVESNAAIAGNPLTQYSVQQLVDCDSTSNGCGGGWMVNNFRYMMKNKGICLATDYKYRNRRGSCQARNCKNAFAISGFYDLRGQPETAIKKALNMGTVAIAVQANSRAIMYYKSGIITSGCGRSVDHAVNIVGYDKDPKTGIEYYIVRNSWGASWGDKGYFKLQVGKNMCGVNLHPSLPVPSGVKA